MNYEESTYVMWAVYEDTLRRWLPMMPPELLVAAATELRPGTSGLWVGMPTDLESRRQLLLDEVVRLAAERRGHPWPLVDDLLPEAPNDVSALG